MHHLSGRAVEQLTFDLQVGVAERLGYSDHGGRRGVEHFMQDYFRHATHVGDLTRIFLTELEARHVKREPILRHFFNRRKQMRHGLKVVHNRLDIANPADFLSDPLNILRLFEEGLITGFCCIPMRCGLLLPICT
jgi:[protein-PII] uridylyltransferase